MASSSAAYYRSHPEARKKKQRYDAKLNKKPAQVKKRVESNAKRREAKKKGQNISQKDYDHHSNRFISVKANRGRKGEGGRSL